MCDSYVIKRGLTYLYIAIALAEVTVLRWNKEGNVLARSQGLKVAANGTKSREPVWAGNSSEYNILPQ